MIVMRGPDSADYLMRVNKPQVYINPPAIPLIPASNKSKISKLLLLSTPHKNQHKNYIQCLGEVKEARASERVVRSDTERSYETTSKE